VYECRNQWSNPLKARTGSNLDAAIVVRTPREVSTQQAATVLNVSRPTVANLIDDGVLPSRKVGSHRRITLADLLAYRDDMVARRRAVLDQMSRDAEELGLYD
jgi:excisionase family DNA binding protein